MLRKLEQSLKQKEKLAEGLHLIDFEQLKIENQTLNEKIEERNEELLKLRKKTTTTVQASGSALWTMHRTKWHSVGHWPKAADKSCASMFLNKGNVQLVHSELPRTSLSRGKTHTCFDACRRVLGLPRLIPYACSICYRC